MGFRSLPPDVAATIDRLKKLQSDPGRRTRHNGRLPLMHFARRIPYQALEVG